MSVRVVGFGVAVDDAVVDGLVSKRMLGIKLYDFIQPKDGCDRRGQSLGNECGEAKWWLTPIDRYDQTSE